MCCEFCELIGESRGAEQLRVWVFALQQAMCEQAAFGYEAALSSQVAITQICERFKPRIIFCYVDKTHLPILTLRCALSKNRRLTNITPLSLLWLRL